jgi:hypothetical protein
MLWLAITGRNAGLPPSELIKQDAVDLDFNLSCALVLQEYDAEIAKNLAKQIADEVTKRFVGE